MDKIQTVSEETNRKKLISLVVPVYNEEENIPLFYEKIKKVITPLPYDWELIFVNDGSQDSSVEQIKKLEIIDSCVKLLDFSRNFGKEMALTAGLNNCHGQAAIMLDADLQHPVEKIPEFLDKWEKGAEVVIGLRNKNNGEGSVKKWGSYLFYKIINQIADVKLIPNTTDFRLIDREVIDEFDKLSEKNRMTRALVDWLGYRREYITFEANARIHGQASYSFVKLAKLAFNSMISLSLFPLRIAGYLGLLITVISGAMGISMFVIMYITQKDTFTALAMLAVMILFLVGIILICLGLIAMYIAHIHEEVISRPLYVIRKPKKK